jgi:hypothetical protein
MLALVFTFASFVAAAVLLGLSSSGAVIWGGFAPST